VVGELEIKGVFKSTKASVVCGGTVTSGVVRPKQKFRVKRGSEIIGEGTLTTLQKDKQEAREAFEGETCGMSVATTAAIELGDKIEFYTREEKARTL